MSNPRNYGDSAHYHRRTYLRGHASGLRNPVCLAGSSPRYRGGLLLGASILRLANQLRWCGQPGSNRHSACAPRDFKSLASTNSAMPA